MSQKDKLKTRLLSRPKDFTFIETTSLLKSFGYIERKGGKTRGSRVAFINSDDEAKLYAIKEGLSINDFVEDAIKSRIYTS